MTVGEVYFLAVHVHQDYPFANKVGDFYNKIEVTNNEGAVRQGTWLRDALLENQDFLEALNAKQNKPGYTEQLRESLGGNAAFYSEAE